LNILPGQCIAGSAGCLADAAADLTIANINATVLLSILNDLLRITRRPGRLILTGFPAAESAPFQQLVPSDEVSELDNWCCLAAMLS
jgi:ribosomal protein L11 methylase PrmA